MIPLKKYNSCVAIGEKKIWQASKLSEHHKLHKKNPKLNLTRSIIRLSNHYCAAQFLTKKYSSLDELICGLCCCLWACVITGDVGGC